MNKKILIPIIVIAIFIIGAAVYFIFQKPSPEPQIGDETFKPKVYITHFLHIEPGTPKNKDEFLLYAEALDKFLDIAEKHDTKISIQVEKEWAEACLKYDKKVCQMIEERGHELGTHAHNYIERVGIQKNDSFDVVKQKMLNYIKERKEPIDSLAEHDDTVCWGKFESNGIGRKLFLASHQASIELGFKNELTAHDDLNYLEYYSHPHLLSYDNVLVEDPNGEIVLFTGKQMTSPPRGTSPDEGEMHPERLNEFKKVFKEIYENAKAGQINIFNEGSAGFHIEPLVDIKSGRIREEALRNFDEYLSFFDAYIKNGTAKSVTFRELSEIYKNAK